MSPSSAWRRIVRCGEEFCLQTSIHGFNHIALPKRHWTERVLWVFIAAIAIWGVAEVSLGQFQRYMENPTVVTLEKDFRSWHFALPGVTICEQDRVDPSKMAAAIKKRWQVHPEDDRYPYYSRFVETVVNSDLFHLDAYQEFKDDEALDVDLYQLAVEVMAEHEIKTTWSGEVSAKWTPVMTEAGACYTINSVAVADVAICSVSFNGSLNLNVFLASTFEPVVPISKAGNAHGTYFDVVAFHGSSMSNVTTRLPLTCKYSSLSCYVMFETAKVIDIYIHSPYDVADITSPASRVFLTLNRITELSVTETRTGNEVRALRPHRRRCLYTDEPSLKGRQVYSTNTCRLSCRNRLAVQLCGCRPFYYFYGEGKPCDPAGMWCLASFANQLANFGGLKCPCSQQCVDALFREISTSDQLWDRGPFQNRGAVRFTVQAPRTRYTREIVFHFEDLVVSFGGAAGLFLGASFISFVEIIYFFLEKLIKSLQHEDKKQVNHPTTTFERIRIKELAEIPEESRRYGGWKNKF